MYEQPTPYWQSGAGDRLAGAGALYTVRRRQLKYGPSGGLGAGAVSKDYASVPRNKLGSAHPLDSKWQITSYLLYWVSNRIFWGAPSGRCSSRREWEPEAAKRVDAGASHPSPPFDLAHWNDGPSY
jgi:hypothetical protein